MSNDLISRSALMQSLRNNVLVDVTPNLEQAIEEQPTAYYADKVVEGLRLELGLADKEKERCAKENPLQFDEAKGYARGVAVALEVVKSGSIE